MELSKEKINVEIFNVSFQNDYDTGLNELEIFANIVKKWHKESSKSGFKKLFNNNEREMITGLYDNLFNREKPPSVQNMSSSLTYIDDDE
jgi:hypothetical protein